MNYPINLEEVTSELEYYEDVINLHKEAVAYLNNFKWCKSIHKASVYLNLGNVLCIFLFDIDNSASKEDNLLWIVVGDLPSIYLDTYGVKTTTQVVEDYIYLATEWIQQVKTGGSLEACFPFKATPTIEAADLLERRIDFMKNTLLANMDDIALQV